VSGKRQVIGTTKVPGMQHHKPISVTVIKLIIYNLQTNPVSIYDTTSSTKRINES